MKIKKLCDHEPAVYGDGKTPGALLCFV